MSVGLLSQAQTAATGAVMGAPANPEYRKLLAEIFISRRDGVRALRTLGSLSADDPVVLRMSAEAALLVGGAEALTVAGQALADYLEAHPDEQDVPVLALTLWGGHYDSFELRQIAAELSKELSKLTDVSDIRLIGGQRRQVPLRGPVITCFAWTAPSTGIRSVSLGKCNVTTAPSR